MKKEIYVLNVQRTQREYIQIVIVAMDYLVFAMTNASNALLIQQVRSSYLHENITIFLYLFGISLFPSGIYPDCECEAEDDIFSAFINQCYIGCGGNSIGLHPDCKCNQPDTYYKAEEFACKSNIGRDCPMESIGTGPECLCVRKNYVFNRYSWSCSFVNASFAYPGLASCPGGNWPQCPLEIDRNTLLSLIG